MMDAAEALKIIQRQSPCPHESLDTSLGDGKTWAKCNDCGATLQRFRLAKHQEAAKQFDDAVEWLRAAFLVGAP